MNKDKVIHQIFVSKVAETIGFEKTKLLLKGARDVFEVVSEGEAVNECGTCGELLYFFAKNWNENQTTGETTINSDDIKNCIEKYNCG